MKTLTAVISALLISACMMMVSSPAQAVVYPKSIATKCNAASTKLYINRTTRPRLAFSAAPTAGNGAPRGIVTITYTRRATGKVVRNVTRSYTGGKAVYTFARLGRGNYNVYAVLRTGSSSVFKNCGDGARQIVRR